MRTLILTGLAACCLSMTAKAAPHEQEIADIAARPDVTRALAIIDESRDVAENWLIELTEIEAPPFKEANRGIYFSHLLELNGVDEVSTDAEGNVLGRIPGQGGNSTLAVVAHLDTVFPEGTDVRVRKDGSQYCAPGIGDNGRGLVATLLLARAITAAELAHSGDILLVGSVGEEGIGDLRGVRYLLREGGPKIDEFIAIDGGGASRITTRAVGSIRYRLVVRGPGGHSYGAFGLANPAHALSRAIHYFDDRAHGYVNAEGAKTTYNIGRIGGGTSVNSIPFENWAEIDMRSPDPDRLAAMDEILKTAVAKALDEQNDLRTSGEPLTVEFERIGYRPAGRTDHGTPLVQRIMAAMRYHNLEPALREGSTDANVPMSLGIPAVTIGGGGDTSGAHALHECWTDDNSETAVKNVLLAVLASVGLR